MCYSRTRSSIATASGITTYLLLMGSLAEAQVVQLGAPPGNSYPVVISAPGSYELTANLTPGTLQDGIDINADNVTLNLNGFSIVPSQGFSRAIGINSGNHNIVVSDGTVQDLNGGIFLGDNCEIRNVRILGASGDYGSAGSLRCGTHSAVEDVLVDNGGIVVGAGSRIKSSTLVGGHNVATNSNNPALTCPSGCLATEDIFEQGAVNLGSSGYADSFLGAGAFGVGGSNRD